MAASSQSRASGYVRLRERDIKVRWPDNCHGFAHVRQAATISVNDAKQTLGIAALEERVSQLQDQLNCRSIIAPIQSLYPHPIDVVKPIFAVIQSEDHMLVASFIDANINASGDCELSTMEMLKDRIATSFLYLSANESRLGNEPARQLSVLREFLKGR